MHPVQKPPTIADLGPVDVTELRRLVSRLSDQVWQVHDAQKENRFAVLNRTRHIVFRFFRADQDPRDFVSSPIWHVWQPVLTPILTHVAASYGYAHPIFPKVMLARLPAGGHITRHTDGGAGNLLTHKIHVPLEINEGVTFQVGDQDFRLELERAYEVNNIAPHGGMNRGDSDRIHLIFEVCDAPPLQAP